jgi:hypothetical protein
VVASYEKALKESGILADPSPGPTSPSSSLSQSRLEKVAADPEDVDMGASSSDSDCVIVPYKNPLPSKDKGKGRAQEPLPPRSNAPKKKNPPTVSRPKQTNPTKSTVPSKRARVEDSTEKSQAKSGADGDQPEDDSDDAPLLQREVDLGDCQVFENTPVDVSMVPALTNRVREPTAFDPFI